MSNEVEFEYTGKEKEDIPKDVTVVQFHSSVTEVNMDMFRGCERLKKLVLNEGLRKIGECIAYNKNCNFNALERINFPSTLIEIGRRAFFMCDNLREVVLNNGLQTIKNFAFARCSLECITIPHTVTEIGDSAFYYCRNLREIDLQEGIQSIAQFAFSSTLLERITIPSTVTKIYDRTFACCQNLREVDLHEGIQMISSNAFDNCPSLERFKFPSLSTRLDTIINDGKYDDIENKIENICGLVERRDSDLFIPASSPEWYMSSLNWKVVKEILDRIDQLITYYELKEATTLLELAMWRSKIDQAEVKHINCNVYRIDIPGPVKDTILQYLDFRV